MQKQNSYSPLLLKYLKAYETNPRSRVFAPLAETYRKMGMGERAMAILKEGIKNNPSYTLGYLGLSFCYFDQEQYSLAYTTLRPLVGENRDNLRLQKLFGNICIKINHLEEALETFKYLLFINSKDEEAAKYVSILEDKLAGPFSENDDSRSEKKNDVVDEEDFFEIGDLNSSPMFKEENNWSQVDFAGEEEVSESIEEDDSFEEYTPDLNLKEKESLTLEDNSFGLSPSTPEEPEKNAEIVPSSNSPVVTHTLVDLYCAQGHLSKAMEVLHKILELNPDDKKTLLRLDEIQVLVGKGTPVSNKPLKDEGRSKLMAVFDSKVGKETSNKKKALETKLIKFQNALKKRARITTI